MNSNNSIIGTLRDVRNNKNDKPRIEIHFKLEFENFFQEYGYTNPKGYCITIIINGEEYSIGFHKTLSNNYMWLSSRLDRDGYQLADILIGSGFLKNEQIQLIKVDKDKYKLEK